MCLDLHRHDEFSSFDGFGKAQQLARLAKQKGLTSLGNSNHGNMNGLVEHYKACKEEGIKPILGVEAYFQPKFYKKQPKPDTFHLCLYALNLDGYKNLNRIMTIANIEQKYRKPIIDFPLLEKYSEGVIVTSGCIASFISQTIIKNKLDIAEKAIDKFINIFGKDNFYVEIQPYKISEPGLQEKVNIQLIKFAKKKGLKMVLTSDSHYGSKDDFDTYSKMHEINGSGEYNDTYTERYMPTAEELKTRFIKMHGKDFKDIKGLAHKAMQGLKDIEDRADGDMLDKLPLELPKVFPNALKTLKKHIIEGLKEKGIYNTVNKDRVKRELDIIKHHGFEDYFLIVEDYVKWAKAQGIKVGPGRGSVCNFQIAYALDITDVDAVYFDLDPDRFLRKDKKKLPDVDLDFETDRRDEVINYLVNKYKGKAAQICSYGLYKVDNLLNDLAKVCGVGSNGYASDGKIKFVVDNDTLKEMKSYVKKHIEDDVLNYEKMSRETECRMYNKKYDNILLHFSKMYGKVKYIGTHAAGVAVVGGELLDYVSLESRGGKVNKVTGKREGHKISTAYDLNNLEAINVIKFDMLGLRTLSIIKDLEEMTDECFEYEWLEDESVYDYFREGNTEGVFQLEKQAAKDILKTINTDSFGDVVAASSLNRPGPLSMQMHVHYGENKESGNYGSEKWADFTNTTYGTIIYQEQITRICKEIGLMSAGDADKVMKFMKGKVHDVEAHNKEKQYLLGEFLKGAKKSGMSKSEATELFESLIVYSFNQGHATGYSLISFIQMWYKKYFPNEFWYVTLKYAGNESDLYRLKVQAVKEGNIILIPHVNYESKYSIVTIDGENALVEGLSNIKGVGEKAADVIENERYKNGKYKNKDNFLERISYKGSPVNKGVIRALEDAGALVFDKNVYFERVKKWNSSLYMQGMR